MMPGGGVTQYGGVSGGSWEGGGSYGMPQRMPSAGMNQVMLEEQRRQALRMRQKQFLQMHQVRRMQQQQQQASMAGQPPPGMGMYAPPSVLPHMVQNTGVMPPGMPPSYGQLTNMGGAGGMPPPHSLSQGMPGGPGPMGM